MTQRFTICVFCGKAMEHYECQNLETHFCFTGSSFGLSDEFIEATRSLALEIHLRGWSLVYGGGTRGLMGVLAESLVKLSGPSSVHGITPRPFLQTSTGICTPDESRFGRTTVVSTMHERKALMAKEADAFLALPGGYGTMEELFEMITWNQLGIHTRPVVLLNTNGFFDGLICWIEKAMCQGFISAEARNIVDVAETADEVIEKIEIYQSPIVAELEWL